MFISDTMTKDVVTVDRNTTILNARELMKKHRFRHLPVVSADGVLEGLVSDRDLRNASPSTLISKEDQALTDSKISAETVERIMTKDPVTISPAYTIQDALLLIQDKRVGAVPVVGENGKLKGICSVRDLLRAFINVMGIGEPGTLIGIIVKEEKGQLKKIVDAITEENISFGSVLVARYWEEDKRAVFIYLLTSNVTKVKVRLVDIGYTLIDPMQWYLDRLPKNE